ncbi:MAG: ATP-grasp domain-containing protein [Treponema sp.]|nr:ATP-grasp domain-containing protein [Treponema sp.]
MCDNLDDVKNAVEKLLTYHDVYGKPITSALVQERIVGTEYIVNTSSCNGKHALNSFSRCIKERTAEGGYIYDYMETISRLEQGHAELIEYAFKVADAIGFKYGVIHGEYMIDKKGPVLIEVNCRPMGCTMPAEFYDKIFEQHESDSLLDAYLDPAGFSLKAKKPYHPLRKGLFKLIMIPHDIEAEDHPNLYAGVGLSKNGHVSEYYRKRRKSFYGLCVYQFTVCWTLRGCLCHFDGVCRCACHHSCALPAEEDAASVYENMFARCR